MLLLTEYIYKNELKPLGRFFTLKDIVRGAEKVLRNSAVEIKPPQEIEEVRFFKIRIGTRVKGRMIVFMLSKTKEIVPLLIRLKKDKIFGINMSMNNPRVVLQIQKNLTKVLKDMEHHRFQEIPVE